MRRYTARDAGPLCRRCHTPVVVQLARVGILTHPSCAEVDT